MKQEKTPPLKIPKRGPSPGRALYTAFLGICMAALGAQPASAVTIWEKANEIMKDVYKQILGIDPGATLVVKETQAKDGYLLDDVPQTAVIRAGQTVTLEFRNQPKGNLSIQKLSSTDKKTPLEVKITYADGSFVDNQGGKFSSNGLYFTDANGQIILSGLTGTVAVTEVASIPGYTIHEETRSQTVVVNPDDTQTLYFVRFVP